MNSQRTTSTNLPVLPNVSTSASTKPSVHKSVSSNNDTKRKIISRPQVDPKHQARILENPPRNSTKANKSSTVLGGVDYVNLMAGRRKAKREATKIGS